MLGVEFLMLNGVTQSTAPKETPGGSSVLLLRSNQGIQVLRILFCVPGSSKW
jgi:hypothetical protein